MAPAAADLILQNLKDFGEKPDYYDYVITGDLGKVGSQILLDLLQENGVDLSEKHRDCGTTVFDLNKQDVGSGGSGCGCAAITLSSLLLPKFQRGEINRILFVPTGALLSTVSFNEGQTVPGIAHGVMIERC